MLKRGIDHIFGFLGKQIGKCGRNFAYRNKKQINRKLNLRAIMKKTQKKTQKKEMRKRMGEEFNRVNKQSVELLNRSVEHATAVEGTVVDATMVKK